MYLISSGSRCPIGEACSNKKFQKVNLFMAIIISVTRMLFFGYISMSIHLRNVQSIHLPVSIFM